MLSQLEIERYQRHFLVEDFTHESQEKLKASSVLVIGAGGLGSPMLMYLAAAGIGRIGIVEMDTVTLPNLQRQILYTNNNIEANKNLLAAKRLKEINPNCEVIEFHDWWTEELGLKITKEFQVLVDCSDNLESRYCSDFISKHFGIPFVYGSIFQMAGQLSVFNYKGGKSYAELFPQKPNMPPKKPIGVLGPVPGVIGSLQAAEVIKIITGIGVVMSGKMLLMSLRENHFKIIDL